MRTFYEILRKLPAVLAGCLANWVKDIFLLKELMSLPDNDIQAMVCFFETIGSFFKVGDANLESLYLEDVIEIINRLKATVAFMNKIESPEIDYERMISLTLYLHLSQQISIELSTLPWLYVSYKHFLSNKIDKASQLTEIDGQQEAFQKDTYCFMVYPVLVKATLFNMNMLLIPLLFKMRQNGRQSGCRIL